MEPKNLLPKGAAAQLAHRLIDRAALFLVMVIMQENRAPITPDSNDATSLDVTINELEAALTLLKEFRNEIQAR